MGSFMQQFIGNIIIKIIFHFFMFISASLLLIMVAEGLTRKAFPKKIQLWKVWSPLAGASVQIFGRTLGGYLLLGIDLAYAIGFYYLAFQYLGWWSPSDALYNPNALATYLPWVSPIALSLSAGFLEECLFRAIPLAGAALLGNRFGKRNLFIGIALILQAIIFGAAHANYPAQPAYARLIELIIPSFIFGLTYIWYGLLPTIISHFVFDVVWFSLPIFISHASSILLDKGMIVILSLVPLLFVIFRRLQQKAWIQLPSNFYNGAWKPSYTPQRETVVVKESLKVSWSLRKKICILIVGFFGLCIWFATTRWNYDTTPLSLNRSDAISIAQKVNTVGNYPWTSLVGIEIPLDLKERNQHIYIWRKFGHDVYKKLLTSYLMPVVFKVRLVRFDGTIEERSEEYELFIDGSKKEPIVRRVHHQYPENYFLESLSKQEALEVAYRYIEHTYKLSKQDLSEILVVPIQRPQRVDWKFLFNDLRQKLELGQARIAIEVAGKNVVDALVLFLFLSNGIDRLKMKLLLFLY